MIVCGGTRRRHPRLAHALLLNRWSLPLGRPRAGRPVPAARRYHRPVMRDCCRHLQSGSHLRNVRSSNVCELRRDAIQGAASSFATATTATTDLAAAVTADGSCCVRDGMDAAGLNLRDQCQGSVRSATQGLAVGIRRVARGRRDLLCNVQDTVVHSSNGNPCAPYRCGSMLPSLSVRDGHEL